MSEVWLRNNIRALWFSMVLPLLLLGLGVLMASGQDNSRVWVRILGGVLALGSLIAVAQLVIQLRRPRLSYRDGYLLVNLRPGAPVRVPIQIVEGFLLGQGPSFLPGEHYRNSETRTIVIRLAEAATEWADVAGIKPALGKWCGGYITIRGTWCEPLSVDLVNRLNQRLSAVQGDLHPAKVIP
jgi:hypothetical protein